MCVMLTTDRRFHRITTLQYSLTHEMLQGGIKFWLTLCPSHILPQSHSHSQCKSRKFLCLFFYI